MAAAPTPGCATAACCRRHPKACSPQVPAASDPLVEAGLLTKRSSKYTVLPPPGGWCDARAGLAPPASDAAAVPALADESDPELTAVLGRCGALRAQLTEHMMDRLHPASPRTGLAEWASHGGGIVGSTSQGSTSLQEFGFIVRLARVEAARRARAGGPREVVACETGFNWGTSALAFLCASPHTRVYSFDLPGGYRTSKSAAAPGGYLELARVWFERRFGSRLNLTLGDSTRDVPRLAERLRREPRAPRCDLVLVDGGHNFPVAYADIRQFRCAARPGALMLADDCDFTGRRAKRGVYLSYRQLMLERRLIHLAAYNFSALPPPLDRWGCLARYPG